MSKEKIVCAAVRFEQGGVRGGENIILGLNYEDCKSKDKFNELMSHDKFLNLKWKKTEGYKKGFITNKNRFVTPEEALEITGMQNQLRFKDRKYLLPEDLY